MEMPQDLYKKNVDFIKNFNSLFLDALPGEEENAWDLVYSDEGDIVNLKKKSGDHYLYPVTEGASAYTQRKVHEWMLSPSRMIVNDYSYLGKELSNESVPEISNYTGVHSLSELSLENIHDLNIDLQVSWCQERLNNFLNEKKDYVCPAPITSSGCALVINGIGLGLQLQPLIDYLDPSALFIVEPDLSILARSLSTLDYTTIIERFTGPDKALDFIVSGTPEEAVSHIRSLITTRNLFLLDGLFTFITIDSNFNNIVKNQLHTASTLSPVSYLGYFIDEIHMTMNASINYFFQKPNVYKSTSIKPNTKDAVVVASGPSLEDSIDFLKSCRDNITIFCCYSTIGRLLQEGIIPDFHCDLERHNDHIPIIEKGYEDAVKDISLCCSATVDPRMMKMYKSVYSINRGALTPSVIFTEGDDIIPNEGPDVATFAILSAIYFGFRRVHLLGVDLGTANKAICRLPGALDIDRRVYNMPVRGNLGRTVFSGQNLLDNKTAIESNLAFYSQVFPDLKVYNYSNGVFIDGAIPSQLSDLALRVGGSTRLSTDDYPGFKPYTDEHVRQAWVLADMRMRCYKYINDMRELSKSLFEISTLYKVSDLCNAYSKSIPDQIPIRFYRGSLFRCWLMVVGVRNRISFESDSRKSEYEVFAIDLINEILDSFEALTFEMIDFVENLDSIDSFVFESKFERYK